MFGRNLFQDSVQLVNVAMLDLAKNTQILETNRYIQHGSTSVLVHMISVALMSLRISRFFKANVDEISMIRGALLHDYFLYDWHDKKTRHKLHGFYHPGVALENAEKELTLNSTERDVIKNHMFPLTFFPPKTKEGLIVSFADKIVSLYETFKINGLKTALRRNQCPSCFF